MANKKQKLDLFVLLNEALIIEAQLLLSLPTVFVYWKRYKINVKVDITSFVFFKLPSTLA